MSPSRLLRSAFLLALCIPLFLSGWTSSMDLVRAALTRPPTLPTKLRDAESELTASRDAGRAYFQDAKIRPEVLAVAPNLRAKSPVDDPNRPAEKELIEAVGDHARLIAETTDFLAQFTAPTSTGGQPPTNPEYARLLEERRKVIPVEAEVRQALADQVPDRDKYETLLATTRDSPAADQRFIVPPPPPPVAKGDVLILVPKTRALVEDRELCDKLTAEARYAKKDKLIGDGIWLVDAKRAKRWPDLGAVASDASTFEDNAWFEGLRAAIAKFKDVAKAKAGADFRTLIVWRCNFNPDEDANFGRVIQLDETNEKGNVSLFWIRQEGEKSNKLRSWFGLVEPYLVPSENNMLGPAFNGFVDKKGDRRPGQAR